MAQIEIKNILIGQVCKQSYNASYVFQKKGIDIQILHPHISVTGRICSRLNEQTMALEIDSKFRIVQFVCKGYHSKKDAVLYFISFYMVKFGIPDITNAIKES